LLDSLLQEIDMFQQKCWQVGRQLVVSHQRRGYYTQPVTSISQIKSDFQHFKGGSIDLDKDL